MNALSNISLYIPHVFPNIDEDRIARIFDLLIIGKVSHVDFVSKTDRHGKNYNSVYIHFDYWYNTLAAVNLQENIFKCHGCQYKGSGYNIIMQKEGIGFREAIIIAEGILNSCGQALPQRTTRGRGISSRSRNNNGAGDSRALGRRLRAVNGA